MADKLKYTELRYGTDNILQDLAVWQFPDEKDAPQSRPQDNKTKYWFVYIHGGAWRDPRSQKETARPSIDKLLAATSPVPRDRIAGFASLNYRLSPHPLFPQEPGATPAYEMRDAVHPDHLADVRAGLRLLQERFGFGADCVLFGHSAGAYLAFQTVMGEAALAGRRRDGEQEAAAEMAMPACVVGFQGVYDPRGIDARMAPHLRSILEGALGPDDAAWDGFSPAPFRCFADTWTTTPPASGGGRGRRRLAVVAYSPEDELVDGPEIDAMEAALRESGVAVLAYRDLKGGHDEVREDATYIARVLGQALVELDRMEAATAS